MACPEPVGSGVCPLGLLRKGVARDPGCCADLAFNKAAFARASPWAVREILILVPLAWAVVLSRRRMALRRATLREDCSAPWRWTLLIPPCPAVPLDAPPWAEAGKGAVAVDVDLLIVDLGLVLSLIPVAGGTPFAAPWRRLVAGAEPLFPVPLLTFPVPLLTTPESVAAEDGSMGISQPAACCWMLRDPWGRASDNGCVD